MSLAGALSRSLELYIVKMEEENEKLKKELKDAQDFLKVRHEHVLQLEQEIEVLQQQSGLGDTDYMLGITRLTL